MIKIKKGQTWSVDILLAVFVFMLIFILFLGIVGTMMSRQQELRLSEQSEFISALAASEKDFAFIKDNKIDNEQIRRLLTIQKQTNGREEIRKLFEAKNEFCIYFEDSNGDLVPMDDGAGNLFNGIGDNATKINDIPCGDGYPKPVVPEVVTG